MTGVLAEVDCRVVRVSSPAAAPVRPAPPAVVAVPLDAAVPGEAPERGAAASSSAAAEPAAAAAAPAVWRQAPQGLAPRAGPVGGVPGAAEEARLDEVVVVVVVAEVARVLAEALGQLGERRGAAAPVEGAGDGAAGVPGGVVVAAEDEAALPPDEMSTR